MGFPDMSQGPARPIELVMNAGEGLGKVAQGIRGPEQASPFMDAYTKALIKAKMRAGHAVLQQGGDAKTAKAAADQVQQPSTQDLQEAQAEGGGGQQPQQPPTFAQPQQWKAPPSLSGPPSPQPNVGVAMPQPGLGVAPQQAQRPMGLGASPQGPAAQVAPSAFAAPPPMASTAPGPSPMMPGQQPAPQMGLGAPPPQAPAPAPPPALPNRAPQAGPTPTGGQLLNQAKTNIQQTQQNSVQSAPMPPENDWTRMAKERLAAQQGQGQPSVDDIPPELWKQPLLQRDVELLTPKLMTGSNYDTQGAYRLASIGEKEREADMNHQDRSAALAEKSALRGDSMSKFLVNLDQRWRLAQATLAMKRRGQSVAGAIAVLKADVDMFTAAVRARGAAAVAKASMGQMDAADSLILEISAELPAMQEMIHEQARHTEQAAGTGGGAPAVDYERAGTKAEEPMPPGEEGPPQQKVSPKLVPRKKPAANPDRPPSPFGTGVVTKKVSASGSTLTPVQQALNALTE